MTGMLVKRAAAVAAASLMSLTLLAGTAVADSWRFHSLQRTAIGCDKTGRAYVKTHTAADKWACNPATDVDGNRVWALMIHFR
ncbi:hypothetical protein GCM10009799_15050 [Nocardiopsis rhodophaea]|uniref:Secreted protein n=1 Tax=Nocardiopsis rhodophaea TaxID=280238 RepID=A0ABN2SR28_9ACTN